MSTVAVPIPEATAPVRGEGRPTAWWGMVCLIMTESTIFAGLIGSYFFYRAASKHWPPPGVELPKLTLTIIFSFVLWGSSIPMILAERGIKRGNQRALRFGLMAAWIMGAAFVVYSIKDFYDLKYPWSKNAYASIYYTTIGLHTFHVFVGLVMSPQVVRFFWLRSGSMFSRVSMRAA